MPQQQGAPQIEFNPGAVQGPFSGMLSGQQPTIGQQQQPTGWSTKTGSILNVVTNFLGGMEKGRVKNYERQEQQRAKERGVVTDYINMKLRDPNLTDEGRAALEKQAMQFMAKSVLGESEGKGKGKGKGGDEQQGIMGHITGAFKEIALGMVGGQMPKKGDKLDPAQIMAQVDDMTKQPQFSKPQLITQAQAQVQKILQGIPPGSDQQTVMRAIQPALGPLQKYMEPKQLDEYMSSVLGGFTPNIPPSANLSHQFVNLVPNDPKNTQGEFSARIGTDGKIYDLRTNQPLTPEQLQGFTVRPSGYQPRAEPRPDDVMVQTWDQDKKQWVYTKRTGAEGKTAPGVAPVAVTGPDNKPQLVARPEAEGRTPAPPAARGLDIQKQANAMFQRIENTERSEQAKIIAARDKALNAIKTKSVKDLQDVGVANVPTTDQGWKELEERIIQQKVNAFKALNDWKKASVERTNRTYYPEMYRNDGGEEPSETREDASGNGVAAQPWTPQQVQQFHSLRQQ